MITDIITNRRFQSIVKELFIRCRKLNMSLVCIPQSYFIFPKEVKLNSTHLIMKVYNKRMLRNIAANHSANINYKSFMNIYKECTSKSYFFLLLILHYLLIIFCVFVKLIIKMTLIDEIKILHYKIKANQAQSNVDREEANISALSSSVLEKYKYLIGKDLGYKPRVVEKYKFQ